MASTQTLARCYGILSKLLKDTLKLHNNTLATIFGDDVETLQGFVTSINNDTLYNETLFIIIADVLRIFKFNQYNGINLVTNENCYVFEDYEVWYKREMRNFNNIIFRLRVDLILRPSLIGLVQAIESHPIRM